MIFKKLMTILLSIGFALPIFSQQIKQKIEYNNNIINGVIIDTSTNIKLKDVTVIILNNQDSIIKKFTRTQSDGSFLMNRLQYGSYLLYVSYPGYVDYSEKFNLDSNNTTKDFNIIGLVLKTNLLKEVIIKKTVSAINIKGDTTEYNAKAYKLELNAKVEDLLKRLPGIQIDKNGKISAQGETINKVLVDGEEFFGDDPTLVTRNLRADMVDKVQLFDKKSDQATLTGMNDGKTDKTLNIKLKEDKKNGYFGKADVGIGTDGYYQGQLMFNSFNAKQRFSVYGIMGNDGKTSLNWQDNAKYATSNIDISEPGMMIDLGGYDELESHNGQYNGKGLPIARIGGIHYDNKWSHNTLSINTNYKIGALTVDGTNNIQTQNNITTGSLLSNSDQSFHNNIFRQKIDGVFQIKPDSTSNIQITWNGGIKNIKQINHSFTTTDSGEGLLLNDNVLNSSSNTDQQNFTSGLLYTKKLKRRGRSFSLNLIGSINKVNTTGLLDSKTNLYINYLSGSQQLTNQQKTNRISNNASNAIVNYSEPLSEHLLMIVNYGLATGNSTSSQQTFNQSVNSTYSDFDSLYSNHFKVKQLTNQFGLNFNLVKNKTMLAFGSKVSTVNFRESDDYSKMVLNRNFTLWNPQVNFQYHISQQSSMGMNYEGNSNEPTVMQLQPVLVNNDPLNIIQGNPNLTPSFSSRILIRYQSYNPLNGQLIGVFASYQSVTNPVVSNLKTDATGRTISRFINLNDKNLKNLNFSVFFDRKIKPLDLNLGINFNINGNTYYDISNGNLNRTNYNVYTLQTRFSKSVEHLYEFNASLGPTYTVSGSSLQKTINNNGRGFTGNGDFTVYLPGKFQISSNINYQYNSKTATFNTDFSKLILNSSLSKLFLREQTLKLSLLGNDLLNQNTGFNRNVTSNMITQSNYNTIKRCFMIALTYDFNKTGSDKIKNN
ncbi:outer membrane beta-barrel protein [Sphingobacterium sp. SRCM116780]|uniref:outer membrane beta-barrel protein n=1 Tax=Sphingobacterium sp. SRCM116780 TaxID=2907623 RepID=UPI001F271226|nr:outer membrane beta-barrel protein [Sphingobacterium sp. SRCM116780]UIR55676.1 outer membrane beta-barrel protein [Sphingobacterium sp. SRCM116780]